MTTQIPLLVSVDHLRIMRTSLSERADKLAELADEQLRARRNSRNATQRAAATEAFAMYSEDRREVSILLQHVDNALLLCGA
jgi:hypothetical protein